MALNRIFIIALLAAATALLPSCREKDTEPPSRLPPDAPSSLAATVRTDTSITLRWLDRSDDELGFLVYGYDTSGWAPVDTTEPGLTQELVYHTIGGLQPGTAYRFRVTAYNDYGESTPTAEITAQTETQQPLPNAPGDVRAAQVAETVVRVTWTDRGTQDSFLVERRTSGQDWVRLGSTVDQVVQFFDSTVAPSTQYFYRVGSLNPMGITWGDSAEVTTAAPGAPLAPDSLTTQVIPGRMVVLNWIDRSTTELGFHIRRGLLGTPATIIDSVGPNTTVYHDSLRDSTGLYYYQVRSFNAAGASAWTPAAAADFRFCSNGVIPLCADNYWEYRVDSVGGEFTVTRHIAQVAFVDSLDFYLIGERRSPAGPLDSLYYLRNQPGLGTLWLPHPPSSLADPDTLFLHPASIPSYYFLGAQRDCVVVVVASPGIDYLVRDRVFENVVAYQQFSGANPGHSTIYYVSPFTVGIVREDVYRGSGNRVARRDLVAWSVSNQP